MALGNDSYLSKISYALESLAVFQGLGKQDAVLDSFRRFLETICTQTGDKLKALTHYQEIVKKLLEHSLKTPFPAMGSIWQDYLLDNLLLMENGFTRRVEQQGLGSLSEAVLISAKQDLLMLQRLYNLEAEEFEIAIKDFLADNDDSQLSEYYNFTPWYQLNERISLPLSTTGYAFQLKQSFQSGMDWDKLIESLASYYRTAGTGDFSYCHTFCFRGDTPEGLLKPIMSPDPIRLANLVGYEFQRGQVISNTEQFVKGFSANNLLLYGDRGTGKSSTIKTLIHEYGNEGLRMVEMAKQDLIKLPILLDLLRERSQKFIIFIDDLSFEEGEVDYKHLKAILEGSLEARPKNVLIYATSNRRHLIQERYSDREWIGDKEVRSQDTLQEKLSLADRFGITITFTSPDQEQYLEIVVGLAEQEGLKLEFNELREQALKWALWHNGRSGRTARQFIDNLVGQIGMEAGDNH